MTDNGQTGDDTGARAQRIRELVRDVRRRREAGESVPDDSVVAAHPELMPELGERLQAARLLAVAREEVEVGDDKSLHATEGFNGASTPGGLQIRCPFCHHSIDAVADTPFTDIACTTCGSNFNLAGDDTETRAASSMSRVGHFELVERLGLGGFGTVWKARDTELDRTVAVKIPRKGQLAPDEAEQFLREARNAAQLKHPNIVAIHEVGRDGDTIYIVSDLVRGVSLADWLTGRRPTIHETARMCRKIAEALDHAHQMGVIHRDLKPQNVVIDGDLEPHLMDFGLAKREAGEVTMTMDGQVLGTPAYMSPEQARGEAHRADSRSDIYSLGVILFELLTGELPFRGNVRMLIHQVTHDEPPSPRKLNSEVPRDIETICLKCLEKDPRKRYDSGRAVADELGRFLGGEPVLARPVSRFERTWRRCKRNPVISALAAAFAVALIAGLVGVSWQWVRAERYAVREQTARRKAVDEAKRAINSAAEEARARQTTRRLLYVAHMNVAQEAWEANNVTRVLELLNRYWPEEGEEDLRGFQWYYLWRLCQRGLKASTLPYSGPIWAVAFSPDNKTVAAAGYDYKVKLWNVETHQLQHTLTSKSRRIPFLAFSPDGKTLAIAEHRWGGWVKLTDLATGEGDRLDHNGTVFTAAYSPDGKLLATVPLWQPVMLWDLATGEHRVLGSHGVVYSVVFSPDGKTLASGSQDNTVKLWDVETGDELATLTGHTNRVHCVAFSADGTTLASASFDNTVKLWHVTEARQPAPKGTLEGHTGQVWSVVFAPDGMVISGSADNTVKTWDPDRRITTDTLKGHGKVVSALAFSPDGKTLASASFDGNVKLWDMDDTVSPDTLRGHTAPVRAVAITPDGKHVVSGSDDHTARVWDLETGRTQRILEGHDDWVNAVAISPDGKTLATAGEDNQLIVWDLATGQQRDKKERGSEGRGVRAVAFAPDGETLVTGDDHYWARMWGCEPLEAKGFVRHGFWVNAVAFSPSPDDPMVASGGHDSRVQLWDPQTFEVQPPLDGHDGWVLSLTYSPDGKTLASGSYDNSVILWDVETATRRERLTAHAGAVGAVAFSPDGRILASGSTDNTIKLWYLNTEKEPETLIGHTSDVSSIVFSPDGNTLISGSFDKTVRLWRRATEEEVRSADR